MESQPTVLLVVCRSSTRILLEMFLSNQDIEVFTAPSVHSALLQLRILHPDLIIVDGRDLGDTWKDAVTRIKAHTSAAVWVLQESHDKQHAAMQDAAVCMVSEVDEQPAYPLNVANLTTQLMALLGDRWVRVEHGRAGHRG